MFNYGESQNLRFSPVRRKSMVWFSTRFNSFNANHHYQRYPYTSVFKKFPVVEDPINFVSTFANHFHIFVFSSILSSTTSFLCSFTRLKSCGTLQQPLFFGVVSNMTDCLTSRIWISENFLDMITKVVDNSFCVLQVSSDAQLACLVSIDLQKWMCYTATALIIISMLCWDFPVFGFHLLCFYVFHALQIIETDSNVRSFGKTVFPAMAQISLYIGFHDERQMIF